MRNSSGLSLFIKNFDTGKGDEMHKYMAKKNVLVLVIGRVDFDAYFKNVGPKI